MIEARGLTKRYGSTVTVPGRTWKLSVSTAMRLIMGLDAPDTGQARIGGRPYRALRWPLREVGALLEAYAFHPGRSARSHLMALAASWPPTAARCSCRAT